MPLRLGLLQLLDLADAAHLIHAGQADRPAFFTGAAGAADAVNMHFGIGRHVDIDDHLQLRNIQPARRHVGCHQHRAAAVRKLHQHLVTLALLQLAEERQRTETVFSEVGNQGSALRFGVAKRQRADRPVMAQHLRHRAEARLVVVTVRHLIPALADFAFLMLRLDPNGLRRFHELLADLGDAFRVGG